MKKSADLRDQIFLSVRRIKFAARITSQGSGILSGTERFSKACRTLGIRLKMCKRDGQRIGPSDIIAMIEGNPKQLALAEEELIGWISKSSGIATAARNAKTAAGKHLRVVSGAWKKMPLPLKDLIRQAQSDGGVPYRISDEPFIYLDKNYVKIFGGVEKTLLSLEGLNPFIKIVQLKSKGKRLCQEASLAARLGAGMIMIDTGRREDIETVDLCLKRRGLRHKVKVAFGGDVRIEDLKELKRLPVEIVDIGKAIVDAPLLDMRMDILGRS